MGNPRVSSVASKPAAGGGDHPAVHAIWSGTLSFSLVAIPVRLVKAVKPGRVSFRLLHSKDYSPLVRRMFCPADEAPVPPEEIIRGYEVAPGQFLPITEEELDSVSPERSRTIEVIEFIDIHEVDPVHYDQPYYLVPAKGGEKAYRLLMEVLHRSNKAGLAKFVLHDREHLVAVTGTEGALALITLHYHDEILPDEDASPKEEKIEAEEKSRFMKIIKKMAANFNPAQYADQRRDKIMALLKEKAKEKGLVVEAPVVEEEEGEGPPDLIAALEESMRRMQAGP